MNLEISMNKIVIAVASLLVLVIGGVSLYVILNPKPTDTSKSNTPVVSNVKACDILTEKIAKAILGDDIVKATSGVGDVTTSDVDSTNCNYSTNVTDAATIPKTSGVGLFARIAKTQKGADDNVSQFNSLKTDVQAVSGIGDNAFFSPTFRQIDVLKGGNWYVVTYYVDTITNSTIDTDKALAQMLAFK